MTDRDTPRQGEESNSEKPGDGESDSGSERNPPASGAAPPRRRAGRKASKAEDSGPGRPRTSALDPWKKARERISKARQEPTATAPRSEVESEREPSREAGRRSKPQSERRPERVDRNNRRADERSGRADRPRRRRVETDGDKPAFYRRPLESDDRPSRPRFRPRPGSSDAGSREDRPPRRRSNRRDDRSADRPNRGQGSGGRESRSRGRDDRGADRRRGPGRGGGPSGGPKRRAEPSGTAEGPRERQWKEENQPRSPAQIRAGARLSEVEEIELSIDKLIYGGDGLGRLDGIPIFVPRSAPGDRIRARISERKLGYGRAEILEILEPGEGRREAPCPHFEHCGGCDLQHLDDQAQLRLKSETVVETLRRIGHVTPPAEFEVISGDTLGYRLRAQLHVAETERGLQAGYFARGSHDLVPVRECPVLVPQLAAQLPDLPRRLAGSPHARMDLAAGDDEQWAVAPPHGDLPTGELDCSVAGFRYTFDARCFFQGHRGLVNDLVSKAVGTFADAEGTAYDLFAGVGLFSLPLSRHYQNVVSVEGDRVAGRFARRNAKANQRPNVEAITQSVESWIEQLPRNASRVLVDPPRVGLSDKVRRALLARKPKHLTYVSCEPPTLARDLKELTRFYRIDSLTLIDMFPQTGHMESVAQLTLAKD